MKIKNGVILAAGKGVRLDRVNSPKPLVKVGNKPLIVWNICQLQDAGVKNVTVVVGDRGNEIKRELLNYPEIQVSIVYKEQPKSDKNSLITSLLSAHPDVQEPFYLTMADLIIEKNPYELFEKVKRHPYEIVSLISLDEEQFERSGANSRTVVEGGEILELGTDLKTYNGLEVGVYRITPKGLKLIEEAAAKKRGASDLYSVLHGLSKEGEVGALTTSCGEWYDVNTPATHIRAELSIRKNGQISPTTKQHKKKRKLPTFGSFYRDKHLKSDIVIKRGLIDVLDQVDLIPETSIKSSHFIITDSKVNLLYGNTVQQGLSNAGFEVHKLIIPEGEASKNIDIYARLADDIFSLGMDKESFLISLGGGVVNNIAGFLAATLFRGIGLIHIPTSMMSQVDASIDFKQAINTAKGKNLLGAYYSATTIAIDPNVLSTLDDRNIRNGIAESIKHGLTQDKNLFNYLYKNASKFKDVTFLEKVVKDTVALEIPLLSGNVEDDYNEMLPQYAHSVGHAIEHLSSYELLHGEAVSIAMCVTAEIGYLLKICNEKLVDLHYNICKKYGLPTKIPKNMKIKDIVAKIRYDKHHVKGAPHIAVLKNVGEVWHDKGVHGVPIDYEVIERALAANKKRK